MEQPGWVSIWLGTIEDEDALRSYVDVTYDEDGEAVLAQFFIDFNIDWAEIDEDFIEKTVKRQPSDMFSLLEGCSYEEIIVPKIKTYVQSDKLYNSVILLYNFQYTNEFIATAAFDFIMATEYE